MKAPVSDLTPDQRKVTLWCLRTEEAFVLSRIAEDEKKEVLLEGSVQRVSPALSEHLKHIQGAIKALST